MEKSNGGMVVKCGDAEIPQYALNLIKEKNKMPPAKMSKWEYTIQRINGIDFDVRANGMGSQGWELIHITVIPDIMGQSLMSLYFKRPVIEKKKEIL
jgi:hypothetical protein